MTTPMTKAEVLAALGDLAALNVTPREKAALEQARAAIAAWNVSPDGDVVGFRIERHPLEAGVVKMTSPDGKASCWRGDEWLWHHAQLAQQGGESKDG